MKIAQPTFIVLILIAVLAQVASAAGTDGVKPDGHGNPAICSYLLSLKSELVMPRDTALTTRLKTTSDDMQSRLEKIRFGLRLQGEAAEHALEMSYLAGSVDALLTMHAQIQTLSARAFGMASFILEATDIALRFKKSPAQVVDGFRDINSAILDKTRASGWDGQLHYRAVITILFLRELGFSSDVVFERMDSLRDLRIGMAQLLDYEELASLAAISLLRNIPLQDIVRVTAQLITLTTNERTRWTSDDVNGDTLFVMLKLHLVTGTSFGDLIRYNSGLISGLKSEPLAQIFRPTLLSVGIEHGMSSSRMVTEYLDMKARGIKPFEIVPVLDVYLELASNSRRGNPSDRETVVHDLTFGSISFRNPAVSR